MKTRILIASAGLAASAFAYAPAPIVFDTPAADEKGMMVFGNGEVGAMAWLDAAGTLHTVLQNSDSWNEGGRHVKTGAIDYETKSPVDEGTYRQELSMERGEFEASWKSGGRAVSLRYRIQQGTDSIAVCDVKGGKLLFGVANDGSLVGLADAQDDSEFISETIKMQMDPVPEIDLSLHEEDGRQFVVVEIKSGSETPYYTFVKATATHIFASATRV